MTDVPHVPVLKEETLGFLQPRQGKRIIDGTFGFGGHSLAMLETGDLGRPPPSKMHADLIPVPGPRHGRYRLG